MPHVFKLQDPGEGIHEAEIVEVRVAAGDEVHEGDVLMVVETDKAAVDLPSPYDGRIDSVEVSEGDVVEVGAVLVRFTDGQAEEGHAEPAAELEAQARRVSREQKTSETPDAHRRSDSRSARPRKTANDEDAADDVEDVANHEDVGGHGDGERVRASPATRKLARELDVVISDVPPSGEADRVLERDVRRFAQRTSTSSDEGESQVDTSRDVRREPLRGPRRVTARRMAEAWREIPHVTHSVEADITELESFRSAAHDEHPHLSLTVLLLRAVAAALQRHPRFNAQLDTEEQQIELAARAHIGVAVATDRGLLVPVVRDVRAKSFDAIGAELSELVEKAHARDLAPDEMRGGTFTITNMANAGGVHFTPLINPPQVAILGVATARWVAVVQEDHQSVEPRLLLPLILSFDHRVNDGMDAARFCNTLRSMLTSPGDLLLGL